MNDAFHVYDTTLRDGAQREGLSFSVHDKLAVARHLDELGVGFIEGGWPAPTRRTCGSSRLREPSSACRRHSWRHSERHAAQEGAQPTTRRSGDCGNQARPS
jgi:isopropylmalate/homocitrate/citramalate synthase